jgi:hypothetical protein
MSWLNHKHYFFGGGIMELTNGEVGLIELCEKKGNLCVVDTRHFYRNRRYGNEILKSLNSRGYLKLSPTFGYYVLGEKAVFFLEERNKSKSYGGI